MHVFNFLLAAIWLAMVIAAVADCVKSNNQNKVAWVAVILLLPFLGAFLYIRSGRGRVVSEL